jgi:hypothetical protein
VIERPHRTVWNEFARRNAQPAPLGDCAAKHELRQPLLLGQAAQLPGQFSDLVVAIFAKERAAFQRKAVKASIKIDALSGLALIKPFSISKAISMTR